MDPIETLASGLYWAVPHAPFHLDGGNGHDEVFPGADGVSDGKWVIFYQDGQEVWACNVCMLPAISTVSAVPNGSA
ncbi:hypothetical protein AWV80_13425 [Cupriavidus sp. UYMU48A]|nr:hypothetical protein AWV80_13425 [Cupriavidus sp. UYMU48A]